jgi:hypothetical protein
MGKVTKPKGAKGGGGGGGGAPAKTPNLKRDLYRAAHAALACGAVVVPGFGVARKKRSEDAADAADPRAESGAAADAKRAAALAALNALLEQRTEQRIFHCKRELRRAVKRARDLEVAKAIRAAKQQPQKQQPQKQQQANKTGKGAEETPRDAGGNDAVAALKAADLEAMTEQVCAAIEARHAPGGGGTGKADDEPDHPALARSVASAFARGTPTRRVAAHASVVEAAAALSAEFFDASGVPSLNDRVRKIVGAAAASGTGAGEGDDDSDGSGAGAGAARRRVAGAPKLDGEISDDPEVARMRELEAAWDAELEGANIAGGTR